VCGVLLQRVQFVSKIVDAFGKNACNSLFAVDNSDCTDMLFQRDLCGLGDAGFQPHSRGFRIT
jgi:hypothetical protein